MIEPCSVMKPALHCDVGAVNVTVITVRARNCKREPESGGNGGFPASMSRRRLW